MALFIGLLAATATLELTGSNFETEVVQSGKSAFVKVSANVLPCLAATACLLVLASLQVASASLTLALWLRSSSRLGEATARA